MTHNTTDCILNAKNHSSVYKTEVVQPDQIDRLTIEVTATHEEVTVAGGYFMVGEDTIKIDTIHPEDQDAGAAIKMAILVQTVHIRTKLT